MANYANIKSSGIYRYITDKSAMPARTEEIQRLIVGFSLKGPYNRPVIVRSKDEFKRIFGPISKKLERKGCYFHRTALHALDGGPIICLNVRDLSEAKAGCYSVDLKTMQETKEDNVSPADLHDTSRFWEVVEVVPSDKVTENTYMTISSTVSADEQVTVYISKSEDKDYANTFSAYYSATSQEMPEWAEKYANDTMSDYFLDVWAFKGDVTNSGASEEDLKNPDTLSRKGTSGFIGKWHGIAFPNMYTANGTALSVSDKFNAAWEDHKCVLALSEDWLYEDGNSLEIGGEAADAKQIVLKGWENNIDGIVPVDEALGALDPVNGPAAFAGIREALTNTNDLYFKYIVDSFGYGKVTVKTVQDTYKEVQVEVDKEPVLDENGEPMLDENGEPQTQPVYETVTKRYINVYYKKTDENGNTVTDTVWREEDKIQKGETPVMETTEVEPAYSGPEQLHTVLAKIAQARIGCLAILNLPSFKDLEDKASNDKITTGKDYVGKLTLPDEADGASFCAYYTPVAVVENRGKIIVPSAGAVSVAFQRKWAGGMPYDIVAGPNKGVLSSSAVIGPMVNWSRPDLDELEPFGVNAVVFIPGKGTFVNSNKTALKNPVTTLSAVNVREVCTYLQDAVEKILSDYQWEFNTPELRMTVKSLVDKKCEEIQANGGMYRFVSVCDESNNTDEVIDNEMFVIDIAIEPGRGAGKMIQHLTLYKKGGISAMYNAG